MSALGMPPWMTARICARLLLLQARWDPARMQGPGLAFALEPWLVACWHAEPEALLAARRRHLGYFNTHPIAAWFAAGIICRQEAAAAELSGPARERALAKIGPLKTGLGASLAGLYDSFFWGALRPASALAGILTAQAAYGLGAPHALAWAAIAALTAYNVPAVAARVLGLRRGAAEGERAVEGLIRLPVQAWIRGLRMATVGGALLSFALGASLLGGGERATAAAVFAAGLILSWRGVSPLAQLGFVGLGGAAAGFWP